MDADSDSDDTSYGSLPPLMPREEVDSDEEWDWDDDLPPLEPVLPLGHFDWRLLDTDEDIPALGVIEQHFRRIYDEPDEGKEPPPPLACDPFHQFPLLHVDLQTYILSFVAECPFENPKERAPLTQVLPLVSQHFRYMCQSNYFWQLGLERLVAKDPSLWAQGLQTLHQCDTSSRHFVRFVHEAMEEPGYRRLFRNVVDSYIRVTSPIYLTTGESRLNTVLNSVFSEERHKLLVQTVMERCPREMLEGFPVAAVNGEVPSFILYAHGSRQAFIAEIRECQLREDGSYRVLFSTVSDVRIARLWEEEHTAQFADCFRLSTEESNRLNGTSSLYRVLDDLDEGFQFPFMAAHLPFHLFNMNIFDRAPRILAARPIPAGWAADEDGEEDDDDDMPVDVEGEEVEGDGEDVAETAVGVLAERVRQINVGAERVRQIHAGLVRDGDEDGDNDDTPAAVEDEEDVGGVAVVERSMEVAV